MNTTIAISTIEAPDPRSAPDPTRVARFVAALKKGARFPPVLVVEKDCRRFMVDGFHRVAAAKALGKTEIAAQLIDEAGYQAAIKRGFYFYD